MYFPTVALNGESKVSKLNKNKIKYSSRSKPLVVPIRPRTWSKLTAALVLCLISLYFIFDKSKTHTLNHPASHGLVAGEGEGSSSEDRLQQMQDSRLLLSYLLRWAYGTKEEQFEAFGANSNSDYRAECQWFKELYRRVFNARYMNSRCGDPKVSQIEIKRNTATKRPVPVGLSLEELTSVKSVLLDSRQQLSTQQLLDLDTKRHPKETVTALTSFKLCNCLNNSLFHNYWNITVTPTYLESVHKWNRLFPKMHLNETVGLFKFEVGPWATYTLEPETPVAYNAPADALFINAKTNASLVATMIEYEAARITDLFFRRFSILEQKILVEQESVSHFACFMAALGNNEFVNFIGDRSLTAEFTSAYGNASAARSYVRHQDWLVGSLLKYVALEPKIDANASSRRGIDTPAVSLLASINPDAYFQNVGFTSDKLERDLLAASDASAPPFVLNSTAERKPYFELAYVVMLHGQIDNVELLLKSIYDPGVFILIHVDKSAQAFKTLLAQKLREWFPKSKKSNDLADNIRILPVSHDVLWGHASIVWAELVAFFTLLDMINFEYVINVSGSDYPLVSNENIVRHLRPFKQLYTEDEDGFPYVVGMNFLYEVQSRQAFTRTMWPVFMTAAENMVGGTLMCTWRMTRNIFVNLDGQFPAVRKCSQWMILHSSLLSYMRKDPRTRMFLAHLEHAMIPDEAFFASYILSTPLFNRDSSSELSRPHRYSNFPKRLIYWSNRNQKHPQEFSWSMDRGLIENDVELQRDWFLRKIDIASEPEFLVWIEAQKRQRGWESFIPDAFYPYYKGKGSLTDEHEFRFDTNRLHYLLQDESQTALNSTLRILASFLANEINRDYEEYLKPVKPF